MKLTVKSILWVAGLVLIAFFAGVGTHPVRYAAETPDVRIDTLIVRDTIRDTVPVPTLRHIVRVDTIEVPVAPDTVERLIYVPVPIERKAYRSDDYFAVVEGYNAKLAEIEVYRRTVYVDRIEYRTERNRWGFGVQAGIGITSTGPAMPYIGLGVQYNLFGW